MAKLTQIETIEDFFATRLVGQPKLIRNSAKASCGLESFEFFCHIRHSQIITSRIKVAAIDRVLPQE